MPKAAGVLFEVDSESLGRSEAVANVPGPSRPAAHIKPGESSKATAERKRPAAAKRTCPFGCVPDDELLRQRVH